MPIIKDIMTFHDDMTVWRRDLHAHPEMAYEERRTSDFIASKMEEFGIQVHRGLASTGVVGALKVGEGDAIGLRADMDSLPITEANEFGHRSTVKGTMHACGHDGHVVMLLGAARYLAETRRFSGTVNFVFQPAEENEGGGRRMVEEGLFERFPMRAVFGMHNWPGLDVGRFAIRVGPAMAAVDTFEIVVTGKSAHAAMPSQGVDSLAVASAVLKSINKINRRSDKVEDKVTLTVTQFHAGESLNVIADKAVLRGTVRTFSHDASNGVEANINEIVKKVETSKCAKIEVFYQRRYPPTVNHKQETDLAVKAAAAVVGTNSVNINPAPSMGGEDFAFMLRRTPGCYMWVGNGLNESGGGLHNPDYDFNDEILPIGASYWAKLVEMTLV